MSVKVTYNKELLEFCIKRDNSINQGEYIKLTRDTSIIYKCGKCGEDNCKKRFNNLYIDGGCYCKKCTIENSKEKTKNTYKEKIGYDHPLKSPFEKYNQRQKYKEKTGYDHPLKNPEVQEKMKLTYKEKIGYEYPLMNPEIIKKKKITYKERTGYDNPIQNPKVKEKMKNTYKERTGYDNPGINPEVKEKRKITYKKKTGYDNPGMNPEVKEKMKNTYKEKTGYEHPAKNPEVQEKILKNSYKVKEVISPSGKVLYMQGYEPQAYKILLETYKEDEIIINRKDVPNILWVDENGKSHRYFVDFYIPKDNLMIEIKSERTYSIDNRVEKIKKTLEASKDAGYNIELWILNNKSKIVRKIIQ